MFGATLRPTSAASINAPVQRPTNAAISQSPKCIDSPGGAILPVANGIQYRGGGELALHISAQPEGGILSEVELENRSARVPALQGETSESTGSPSQNICET